MLAVQHLIERRPTDLREPRDLRLLESRRVSFPDHRRERVADLVEGLPRSGSAPTRLRQVALNRGASCWADPDARGPVTGQVVARLKRGDEFPLGSFGFGSAAEVLPSGDVGLLGPCLCRHVLGLANVATASKADVDGRVVGVVDDVDGASIAGRCLHGNQFTPDALTTLADRE